jgi:dolichol-phosphate mannosyltransferase
MNDKKILIIIPTYNELENIKKLIQCIFNVNENYEIIIIDDNSPDGTGEVINNIKPTYPNLHLIKRKGKLGLGTAYLTGMQYGIENKYDIIVTMDADFSHDPNYLPAVIGLLDKNDIGIGSRYVPGGGTENWGIHRKILSRVANFVAKLVLGIKSNDNTAGFRAYKREMLEKIDFTKIKSNGYSFLIELIYTCQINKAKVGETPIIFVDRAEGTSKISKQEIFKAIKTILTLRVKL